tara:strand:+ start:164 stop:628 length:465 start_codon:yes stop_codon:yes gene_type:complete
MNKMIKDAIGQKQVIQILAVDAQDSKDGKLRIDDVTTFCRRVALSDEDTKSVIHHLEDKALLVTPKGFTSFSPLQKVIHRFINDDLLPMLVKDRKAVLEVTEEMLNDVDASEEKPYILNAKGDLIRQACNNTNITEARRVAHAKKLMEDAQPSK